MGGEPNPNAIRRLRADLGRVAGPVWVLCFVSFFADFSSEMVYPIIPLFITGTLGAPALAVGLTEGVAEATAHLTKLFSGRWSDQVGRRRPFVVAGYSLAAAGKAILAVAPGWPVALGGRSVDRFGKGLRTAPRDAMLSDFADESHRGLVFGLHRSMDTLGAVVGPLVGLALLAWFDDRLRVVIAIAIVPGVISIFVLRWLPERGVRAETGSSGWRLGELPRRFYIYLGITLIFMIGNSSDAFLILRAQNLGLTTTLVVLAYVVYNVVYACLALPAGAVSDQIPRGWLVVAGWGVFGAVYAGFALTSSQAALWPLFLVYGAYIALTDGVARALVADLTSEQLRSTAMGLFQGITGMAALFASVGAGLLWDHVSVAAPFVLGSGCALAAAVALAGFTLAGGLRPMRTPV